MLVEVSDFETMLGMTFDAADTARAQQALMLASGEVQAFCTAVTLQRVDNDVVYLRGSWSNVLKVPGQPVHDIHTVQVDDDPIDDFDFTRHGLLIGPDRWGGPTAEVRIEYNHGLEQVPDSVRSVVISRAARSFTNPHQLMQTKMGTDYSISFSADVEQINGLNRSERMTLRRYRKQSS